MTKTEIINAAFRVWGRNFYRKNSLSQLANELKVSKPAFYRHFESKKALTNAMSEYFFDDFASSVKDDFERALKTENADEGINLIVRSVASYFARNGYSLIFVLANIYDRNLDGITVSEQIMERGVDMKVLYLVIDKKYKVNPVLLQLVFASLTFFMSHFQKTNKPALKSPSDKEIENNISTMYKVIEYGLGYPADKTGFPDFEKLEKQIEGIMKKVEPEPLFKAVAEAVAEAGPWDTTMDMVAKRMGLSKSSLYGHFKNRKDMLRRLFIGEFKRIIAFARQGISLSDNETEQLYLGIYSITVYLRSRPEVLIAMGWIRTRKLDLGKPDKNLEIFRLFEDIKAEVLPAADEAEKQRTSHWILFLLINVLKRPFLAKNEWQDFSSDNVENDDIRLLYKFITLGLGGFKR